MKCLVTGGAGFIGSNIVDLLLKRNHEVTVLDNFSTGYKENLSSYEGKIRIIEGDIRNRATVDTAMKGQDAVIHLAASVGNKKSIDEPLTDAECNVFGVINVLESIRQHNVRSITFSSSAGIFGEPQYQPVDEKHPCEPDSPYGATKLCGEKIILSYMKLYKLRAVCLRYFNVYGERQRFDAYGNVIPIFVSRALNKQDIKIFGDGLQTRDFIHVKDIAMANVLSAENPNVFGPINLGTGKSISINDLAAMVNDIVGQDVKILHEPERLGDVRHCTASTEKSKKMLDFEMNSNFYENLKQYCSWLQSDTIGKT
ncbi:MAG TPA: NAD-dependent epimerase/dehydratase family protein [Bacteriovoracaceae bacterium]|nr:NAD-dependent epimerase/dehydratase family protein [Bacteriovoracaceae bacterium]